MGKHLLTVKEVAEELGVNESRVHELAKKERNPLPLGVIKGDQRGGKIAVDTFLDWWDRASVPYVDRKLYKKE